ncbi:MAG: CpsD/CapB family tyrosine-protein kinase [Candidatus Delongbacteria bacterium]|nr:CpsD/CapB family tyrosine-protein kinase [Candidatus Delongbacteria bacterium]
MSIYRELLKTDTETTPTNLIPAIRGEIEKIAGFIDYQQGTGKRSFLFTATERGEGSTLILAQTAQVLAQLNKNKRILMVDANLRYPALHSHFGISSERGLLDYLRKPNGGLPLHSCQENLDLVVAGVKEGGQLEKSGLGDFRRLLTEAADNYDTILIDSPATRLFSDAVVLAPAVDCIILAIAAGVSSKGIVKTVIKALTDAGGEVTGIVFNRRKDEIPPFIYRRI